MTKYEGLDFLGITEESPDAYLNTHFRLLLEDYFKPQVTYKAEKLVCSIIEKNSEISIVLNFVIFSLTVNVFSSQIEKIYNSLGVTMDLLPGLMIYGTSKYISRNAFANIFCNLFNVNYYKINSIFRGFHIALDSADYLSDNYRRINNIPIIVYIKNGLNRGNMGHIRKNLKERLLEHPVFLCSEKLDISDNIIFDIGTICNWFDKKEDLK